MSPHPATRRRGLSNRRPGAQPGNANALKHGFYTRRFNKQHLDGVESTSLSGLAEEIALIRIFTRRLVESTDLSADVYDLAGVLRAICLASATITRIIRIQSLLGSSTNDWQDAIDTAIHDISIELGIVQPGLPPSPPPAPDE